MESAPPMAALPRTTEHVEPTDHMGSTQVEGQTNTEHNTVESALGSTIALLLLPGRSILALMPLWSVLCGALMAYAQATRPLHSPQALLALLLAISVVGVLWSTWRALLVDVDWADAFSQFPLPAPKLLSGLPYTTPWSPLGRLFARSTQLHRWSRTAPVELRGAWYSLLVLPALILFLSALSGWPLIALSCAALALTLIEARLQQYQARRLSHSRTCPPQTYTALRAGMQVGLGWLAGHVTLAPLTWIAVAMACCYAIAYQGALRLAQPALAPERRNRSLLLLYGGQIAALGLLALLERPLTAAFAAFLLAPQWLLLVGLKPARGPAHRWYLQRALPFCMFAMLAAAWGPR